MRPRVAASQSRAGAIRSGTSGMTLVEVLATMALLGIFLGIGYLFLKPFDTPLRDGVLLTESFLRGARSNAMATTSACRVRPVDGTHLLSECAPTCSAAAWTVDDDLKLTLPTNVTFDDTTWTVCFSGRGMSAGNVVIGLSHPERGSKRIEVLVGGLTRELP